MLRLDSFDRANDRHLAAVVEIWNAACGPDLSITERGVRYNSLPSTGAFQAGRIAFLEGEPVGFVLATEFSRGEPGVSPRELGWIDVIAVAPDYQRRGVGTLLLDWAEGWLVGKGCDRFRLGGSLRLFAPGLPAELPATFFRRRGYANRPAGSVEWDVARDLRDYESPPSIRPEHTGRIRPAETGDRAALAAFFQREFPGRWDYEHREFLKDGGRVSDFMILVGERDVEGFCWLTFEHSIRSLDRFFMTGLTKPWGQLGPVGIAEGLRGGGWGGALLDGGLRRLRDEGIAGCVIDWTDLLDFYGKFGFRAYRKYEMLAKVAVR